MKPTNSTGDNHPASLLDVREVAARLNCSPRHVRRMAEAGQLPQPVRLGALVRWRSQDIDAFFSRSNARYLLRELIAARTAGDHEREADVRRRLADECDVPASLLIFGSDLDGKGGDA